MTSLWWFLPSSLQSYRPYIDLFSETWKAFSRHPVKRLSDFEGKRVSTSQISEDYFFCYVIWVTRELSPPTSLPCLPFSPSPPPSLSLSLPPSLSLSLSLSLSPSPFLFLSHRCVSLMQCFPCWLAWGTVSTTTPTCCLVAMALASCRHSASTCSPDWASTRRTLTPRGSASHFSPEAPGIGESSMKRRWDRESTVKGRLACKWKIDVNQSKWASRKFMFLRFINFHTWAQ